MRVSVVERDEAFNQVLCQELVSAGHRIATADNASAGLHRHGREPIDVLILGLGTSETEGHTLIASTRRLSPNLKIVVVTTWPELMRPHAREKLRHWAQAPCWCAHSAAFNWSRRWRRRSAARLVPPDAPLAQVFDHARRLRRQAL